MSYVMTQGPTAIPVTTPVDEPTLAIVGQAQDHEPPGTEFASVMVVPIHTVDRPVMAAGVVVTVTVVSARQPSTVYDIVAVPGLAPVTTPEDVPTVAIVGLLLVQTPPVVALAKVVVKPVQTKLLPVIGVDRENIVTVTGIRVLGQPATTCDTYHVVVPTVAVDGVGAVVLPTPPVGVVHQYMVPIPDAVSGGAVDPKQ